MSVYSVAVPGRWPSNVAYLDLETVKVPTEGFVMPNGEPLRQRWRIALSGVGRNGYIFLSLFKGEAQQLAWLGGKLRHSAEVRYSATRDFDEMICRGRFTNARRAHLPIRSFPAVPGAESLPWLNVPIRTRHERGPDIPSREVPKGLTDGRGKLVLVHLLRDVAELIADDGRTSQVTKSWCHDVLTDYERAERVLHGASR
jgi:hypothetical protein